MATLTAINSALQSENGELRQQLDAAAAPTTATGGALPCLLPAEAWQKAPLQARIISLRPCQQQTHHTQFNALSLPPLLPACLQRRMWPSCRRSLRGGWARQTEPSQPCRQAPACALPPVACALTHCFWRHRAEAL
jgi:hypothetical protein